MGMVFKDKELYRAGRAMQEWNENGILAAISGQL